MRLLGLFLAMGAVTYLPRLVPLLVLSQRSIPPNVLRFLEAVPVSVLAAFVAPLVLAPDGVFDLSPGNLTLLVSVPVGVLAAVSRNLMATVLVGSLLMMIARSVL